MKDALPKAIYLKDYKEPAFLIDQTDLVIKLFEHGAEVHSTLHVRRNLERTDHVADLQLDGVDLELRQLLMDGTVLDQSAYAVLAEGIVVKNVPDAFQLQCETWILPQENTCLEGLYKSSGMFCTQCEAEGFRRITYYLDRPDVMSVFSTRIEADAQKYPVLLSNGNLIEDGKMPDGRHFAQWQDPHRKPCYLFALVAGDLVCIEDRYTTLSERDVALKIFVEPENSHKCDHAMVSLKRSMRWDEEVYGREYDLDIFMIVAVNDFNMGAMENKGLNIFNSSCVLASPDTATDSAYQRIEAIVAHEYFHNWSGNRVTCRDWFQLSLKEGFTVYRDAQFSADMNSAAVKRIEDANILRTAQFAEDSGPMAHPIRPDSYMEISNFYTLTVYEKGAEVVRMIHHLLGDTLFRKGSDLYFDRHDGQAVTTEDFVKAMEDASGRDLSQFRHWYSQAGTPVIRVTDRYDEEACTYTVVLEQSCPPTPGQPKKPLFHIPVAFSLYGSDGNAIPLVLNGAKLPGTDTVLELTDARHEYVFENISEMPVPSLLRGLSAPVRIKYDYTADQLSFLIRFENDGFNRWDAAHKLSMLEIQRNVECLQNGQPMALGEPLNLAWSSLLKSEILDAALVAKMLQLPSEASLIEVAEIADIDNIHKARKFVRSGLVENHYAALTRLYHNLEVVGEYSPDADSVGRRALRNTILSLLCASGQQDAIELGEKQYESATNMTDQSAAFAALVNSGNTECAQKAVERFYEQWKHDALVLEQWLSIQAGCAELADVSYVKKMMEHSSFDIRNPNKVRSVIGSFCGQNLVNFHNVSGEGYRFLTEQIKVLNRMNPQIAARMLTPFTRWKKHNALRQDLLKQQLKEIIALPDISKDVYEVAYKSLHA